MFLFSDLEVKCLFLDHLLIVICVLKALMSVFGFSFLSVSLRHHRQCLHLAQQQQQSLWKVHSAPAKQVIPVTPLALFYSVLL